MTALLPRRHETRALAIVVVLAILAIAGYQTWLAREGDAQEGRITRVASTCAQIDRLYSSVAQLAADDPAFTPSQVAALWSQRTDRLEAQGCPA